MNQARRVLFLVLFASVLAAEPGQARAAPQERATAELTTATARWVQRLAVNLRRTAQAVAAKQAWRGTDRRAALTPPASRPSAVAHVHPAIEAYAFRLPPPPGA